MSPLVSLSAQTMRDRGLPPLNIKCRILGRAVFFPQADTPLMVSGPPGGPDHFYIQIQTQKGDSDEVLDAKIRAQNCHGQNFELGYEGFVTIGTKRCLARCWSIQPTPWLDRRATALLRICELNTLVYVTFTAWMDAAGKIVTHPRQQEMLKSLSLSPEPSFLR